MKQFDVSGMSCAACSAHVEKAVKNVDGVKSCSVSLLTNSMVVDGSFEDDKVIAAVINAGYGAKVKGENTKKAEKSLEDGESSLLFKRFLASLAFLLLLMYVSMGNMMFNLPLPKILQENHIAQGLIQLLLSAIIMVINQKFFISGVKGAINRSPNMDTLISMGAIAAFGYSTYALFGMIFEHGLGNHLAAAKYMNEFYFESAAMILTLVTFGKFLESRAKGKTTNALKEIIALSPKTATILLDGKEVKIPAEDIKKGDIFVVKPGESIPADGVVIEGSAAVNESALTGESIPADKMVGDKVSAASINISGFLRCEATQVGEDTAFSKIIELVMGAAATKAPIAKVADKVSGIFVPTVIGISLLTIIIWLTLGQGFGFALARGISVLVISCPCALGLATPVAIMVGSGIGARNGILFKNAVSLEQIGKIKTVVLDKTGTITMGKPKVTKICPVGMSEDEFLTLAAALEEKSEHPLALAVVQKADEKNITRLTVSEFSAISGSGVAGEYNGLKLYGGNYLYISKYCNVPDDLIQKAKGEETLGNTVLYFAKNGDFIGYICVADVIKEDSGIACGLLKKMGIKIKMLTGDNEGTALAISQEVGIDDFVSGVLPHQKDSIISGLKVDGAVAMVGDGINDAPALMTADVGIAIGAGTDIAMESADIVLTKSSLMDVVVAIRLGRATLRAIHQNLFWAFIYNIIGIPLAAGAFISVLGWELNPMFGAAAMSISSFCVVTNALRLYLIDFKKSKTKKLKEKNMQVTIKVDGMMCPRCEAHVKKALESVDGVVSATANHSKKEAVVVLNKEVDINLLNGVIEAEGYSVIK